MDVVLSVGISLIITFVTEVPGPREYLWHMASVVVATGIVDVQVIDGVMAMLQFVLYCCTIFILQLGHFSSYSIPHSCYLSRPSDPKELRPLNIINIICCNVVSMLCCTKNASKYMGGLRDISLELLVF